MAPKKKTKVKRNKQHRKTASGQCRQCGLNQKVPTNDWYHAVAPRCTACGGMLDRVFLRNPRKAQKNAMPEVIGETNITTKD